MKPINYQITNTLVNNLIELEVTKAEIATFRPTTEISRSLLNSRENKEIFHMAHLLGLQMTFKDAEKFKDGRYELSMETNQKVLRNFKNILDFIRANKINQVTELNANLALHFNKILITNWKESWEAKFKTDDSLEETFDDWIKYRDITINPPNSQQEFNSSIGWYKDNDGRINTVLRLGVLIYRLIRISPFPNLNKLNILGLSIFLLAREGYLDRSLFSLVALIDKNSQQYHEILSAASESPTGNITYWLERFTRDFANQLKVNKIEILKQIKESKGDLKKPFLNLNKRQLKILRYLQTIPTVKREDYVQMFEVSTMTAFRDLKALLDKNLVKIEGQGRATQYVLANR